MDNAIIYIRTNKRVKYIIASMHVRYWEDATVNGKKCSCSGDMPLSFADMWNIKIDIDDGKIINWPTGTTADVNFKVCDDGNYWLHDENGETIFETDGYVPNILSPGSEGYGDYVIMTIDENGMIANWKIDLEDFQTEINNEEF
jgi:hypothetical protein